MLKSAREREEEKCGTTYPIMSLEDQEELTHIFDVEPTIQENRIAREKRDMARFGKICEESSNDARLPDDIPSRGMNDRGRM